MAEMAGNHQNVWMIDMARMVEPPLHCIASCSNPGSYIHVLNLLILPFCSILLITQCGNYVASINNDNNYWSVTSTSDNGLAQESFIWTVFTPQSVCVAVNLAISEVKNSPYILPGYIVMPELRNSGRSSSDRACLLL
jgi:hypothetical protein